MQDLSPKFNPRIKDLEIGTRQLKSVKIYPLSAGQEINVVEIVATMISAMGDSQTENQLEDVQVFEMFAPVLKEKIEEVLEYVTDPEDKVTINDFDNFQLAEFLTIIYESNFGDSLKKFKDLWDQAKTLFPSQRSLPKSSGKQVTS